MAKSRAPRGVFGERVTPRTPDRSSFTPPVFGAQWERKNTRAGSWQGFDNPPPDDGPVNTVLPSITAADYNVGTEATVTPGTWSGSPVLTYQWRRNGSDISGETGITYTFVDADFGLTIDVLEIPNGDTASAAASAATAAVAFDPLTIPGLVRWWKANDSATVFEDSAGTTPASDNNDVIGRLADKSGNAAHATQATTANKPLLKVAGLNGRTAIQFDGSNDFLDISSLALTTFTIVIVYQATSLANGLCYLLGGANQGIYAGGSAGGFNGYGEVSGGGILREASEEPTTLGVVVFQNAKLFRNNVEATYGKTGTLPSLTLTKIGIRGDDTLPFAGLIGEIFISTSTLNAAQLDIIYRYCEAEWLNP